MSFYTTRHRSFVPGPHRVAVWDPPLGSAGTLGARLLRTCALAFPDALAAFTAAARRVEEVRAEAGDLHVGHERVRWEALDAPVPGAGLGRWRGLRGWFRAARARAEAFEAELVIVAGFDGAALVAWNGLRSRRDPPTLMFLGGGWSAAAAGGARGLVRRRLLRWPAPTGLRYVLTTSEGSRLVARAAALAPRLATLDFGEGPEADAPRLRAIAEALGTEPRAPDVHA